MSKKVEYWTMHWYGTYRVCSRHRSAKAAVRAAEKCEARGGSHHDIWKCEKQPRPRRKKAGKR